MLNICMEIILLSCDIIWLNKTYRDYVSRWEHTKAYIYILKDWYKSYDWDNVKNDPVKNEHVKIEQDVKTDQDYRGEENTEDVNKTTKTVSSEKQ